MGKITVTLQSEEKKFDFSDTENATDPQLDVTFDSTPEEILDAVQKPLLEEYGLNIKEDDQHIYTVKKIESTKNIYCFPKSPAGDLTKEK